MTGLAGVGIGGGLIKPANSERLLDDAKAVAGRLGIEVLLMDADMVFGRLHLESAAEHAFRAFERGTNVANSLMMEVMLYASGERQLSAAIKKMGVKEETSRVAVVVSEASRLDAATKALEIARNDEVLQGKFENLGRFGIPKAAILGTPDERLLDLVLERVAMVDIMK